MSEYHQMLVLLENIVRPRRELDISAGFNADDICVVDRAEINVLNRFPDPFWQRCNFIDRIAVSELYIIKNLICGKTHGNFLGNIKVGINDFVCTVAEQKFCVYIARS